MHRVNIFQEVHVKFSPKFITCIGSIFEEVHVKTSLRFITCIG